MYHIFIYIPYICMYVYIPTVIMQVSSLVWMMVQVLKILIHSLKRESNALVRALIPGSKVQGVDSATSSLCDSGRVTSLL